MEEVKSKLKIVIIIFFSFFICKSCKNSLNGTPIELMGKELEVSSKEALLVNSASIKMCEVVKYKGNVFSICYKDENNRDIEYIFTNDVNYETREKIKVGDTYNDVKNVSKKDLRLIRGWGYVTELPSGWKVLFDFKSEVNNDSKVLSIFYKVMP